jgi:heterocyst specific transport system permease protein
MPPFALAWLQLRSEMRRLIAALAGISFAVTLILMQLGFSDALFSSAVLIHKRLRGDLFMVSSQYRYLASTGPFSRRRLAQAMGFAGVASVVPIYFGLSQWKNPQTDENLPIFTLALEPNTNVFELSDPESLRRLTVPGVVLFDEASRPDFGPIVERFRKLGDVSTEVNGRTIHVGGLFRLGVSFAAQGNLLMSNASYIYISGADPSLIDLGVIKLKPGVDAEQVRANMTKLLPNDVQILTRDGLIHIDTNYWATSSAIGFIFNLGAMMGLIVGAVIVYQILYTDVSDHLHEYATLKAIGYADRFLVITILYEALIMSILGFIPGALVSEGLYLFIEHSIMLPVGMTLQRAAIVFALTIGMCGISGVLAIRKLKSADPAEVF